MSHHDTLIYLICVNISFLAIAIGLHFNIVYKLTRKTLWLRLFNHFNKPLGGLKPIRTKVQEKRIEKLRPAQMFMRNYKDAYGEQTLGNKLCSITFHPLSNKSTSHYFKLNNKLNHDVVLITISGFSKNAIFIQKFWLNLCNEFWYDTTYNDLLTKIQNISNKKPKLLKNPSLRNVIDINKCSAAEMLSFPGITIAKAQKALKYRMKNKKFDTVEEFLEVISVNEKYNIQILEMFKSNYTGKTKGTL